MKRIYRLQELHGKWRIQQLRRWFGFAIGWATLEGYEQHKHTGVVNYVRIHYDTRAEALEAYNKILDQEKLAKKQWVTIATNEENIDAK